MRRDTSKSGTGSRRRYNTRKIAVGGTLLVWATSGPRQKAPKTVSALSIYSSVPVFIGLRPHLCEPGSLQDLAEAFAPALVRKGNTGTNLGFSFRLPLPFIHSIFLHAPCLLYTLARATVLCVTKTGQ